MIIEPATPQPVSSLELHPYIPERSMTNDLRDSDYIEYEVYLDDLLERGSPKRALPIEEDLLQQVREAPIIQEGLAHTALKAIAISQSTRQFYRLKTQDEDMTYQNLGLLLDKSLANYTLLRQARTIEHDNEAETVKGVISEIAVYALMAYNNILTAPLTRRTYNARPRYVLPSTIRSDFGKITLPGSKRSQKKSGVDFKVIYQEGENPERLVQVKSFAGDKAQNAYAPNIIITAVNELARNPYDSLQLLPRAIAHDARGESTPQMRNRINVASRYLNKKIQ